MVMLIARVAFALAASLMEQGQAPSIVVERGPCLGECPVYRFKVTAAGGGEFEGQRFTNIHGQQSFSITPREWSAFQSALAPYRPHGNEDITAGHPRCTQMATDHPSVSVTWIDAERTDQLFFNFGCKDPQNDALAQALAAAPDLLPVGKLIEDRRLEDGAWERRPLSVPK
ncbi:MULTISPECIES: DUF6438 domain-containing protein [unclassified Ensifer]|uniref:DUF6438 domain-containing protein n=1 Tax=unclassified Ensifer TaxID=2633371 RepID=UPI000AA41E5E|nr:MULTISPECIES: DUF6438 domain-containing protein [unclassified Ensifer]